MKLLTEASVFAFLHICVMHLSFTQMGGFISNGILARLFYVYLTVPPTMPVWCRVFWQGLP